jgi:hypothetical protein
MSNVLRIRNVPQTFFNFPFRRDEGQASNIALQASITPVRRLVAAKGSFESVRDQAPSQDSRVTAVPYVGDSS